MALLGNANAHVTQTRRVKIASELNKALLPLVDEEGNFPKDLPALFETDFAQRSREIRGPDEASENHHHQTGL